MESVIVSIKPEWIEKIVRGEKTIEVRKSAPKETPFKAYIYCTKSDKYLLDRDSDGSMFCWNKKEHHYPFKYEKDHKELFNGKVIGEFICDKVYNLVNAFGGIMFANENFNQLKPQLFRDMSCLTDEQTADYLCDKDGYGWHISDLKIYDKPKKLSEFYAPCKKPSCIMCDWEREYDVCACGYKKPLTRPPQSWQYLY